MKRKRRKRKGRSRKRRRRKEEEECIAHFHCDPHTVVVETGTGLLSGPQTETHGQLKRDTNKTKVSSLGNI